MAVGLGRIMGISIPFNFNSPYKATSIIEFWRRWHITLSRFLRDYVYIPIGGNRKGPGRRHFNIVLVMLLGGLWHGAGWVFVVWGGVHGLSLVANHMWRNWRETSLIPITRGEKAFSWLLTAFVITFSWIFFRAGDMLTAQNIIAGLFGSGGILVLPAHYAQHFGSLTSFFQSIGVEFSYSDKTVYFLQLKMYSLIPIGFLIVLFLPNSQEYFRLYLDDSKSDSSADKIVAHLPKVLHHIVYLCRWRPNAIWGLACAVAVIWLTLQSNTVKSFVYFEF